ncbi:LysM peptidoglycan-binding domain-containing protein [Weissella diestrammenae]|uniref:LysM peptidoglycan-binding domain-containing protein n=1 Tax=Weissella diestrammenae TaxID=1162633 RepID=A0A7G9T447_9LACO|nr:LysM domain-containing protein [Weissella diestrammenae]MCM0583393.1 LysM peptidoglycan-binding domain-containing protein [Weissella diestrammenae]QNN74872.1 LysM peptidoglycan-binding domain-containing protein [Weissella diestrammenae]
MNKIKETALTVAGLTAVFGVGQTAINAATTYTVQGGDTLSDIAAKFNTTVDNLMKANHLKDSGLIIKDQSLVVSEDDNVVASSAASATDVAASAASEATASLAASSAAASSAAASSAASSAAASSAAASSASAAKTTAATTTGSGSVYDQFIAAGGTAALWQYVVMPESGGNPNAVSPNGYHGLGQTKNAWGYGSVAEQTAGMLSYATSRYGSIDAAISFRLSHGWW